MKKLLILFTLSLNLYANELPSFINITFKTQMQDNFQAKGNTLLPMQRTYSGEFGVNGLTSYSNLPRVIMSREEMPTKAFPLDWSLILKPQSKQVLIKTQKDQFLLKAEYGIFDNAKISEFVIGAGEIAKINRTKLLDQLAAFFVEQYGFTAEEMKKTLIPADYHCYFRRKVVRCFNDLHYVFGNH